MDKRNSKKTDQQDKKHEKKDGGDFKKPDRVKKVIVLDSNVGKHPEKVDLKKAEKQLKKTVDSDNYDAKLPPDRGDLKKAERLTKKIVVSDAKLNADRGDLKKIEKKTKKAVDSDTSDSKSRPDGGDSGRKIIKIDKPKLNVIIKTSEDKPHPPSRENIKKLDIETIKPIDDKRKIREKYTLKSKNSATVPPLVIKTEEPTKLGSNKTADAKIDRTPKKGSDIHKEKSDESNESKQSISTINHKKLDRNQVQRKPIIRTISSKNDTTKIYKAVTFVDQKKKPTMLQIKIPNETAKNTKNMISAETMTVKKVKPTLSGVSVKEKTRKKPDRRKRQKQRDITSPSLSLKTRSPPTEVAKWAPSSINRHTKPYYEAWVSTTLAAISKNSRKDKLFLEKQNILQSFQRALAERPETPELVYENSRDERYTGRIKVKQR